MECFGTTDFDNNSRLITLSVIIISGLHCIKYIYVCHQMEKVKEPCQRVGSQQYSVTDLLPAVGAAALRVSTLSRHPKWLKMCKAHLFLLSKLFSFRMLHVLRQCDIWQWVAIANIDLSPYFRRYIWFKGSK